jgi:hypothetical protein
VIQLDFHDVVRIVALLLIIVAGAIIAVWGKPR